MLQHSYVQWIGGLRGASSCRRSLGYAWGGWVVGARRFPHRRCRPRRFPPALHVLHQFALPLHRQAPVFLALQRARFVDHGGLHLRRGLPQLSPRVSARLPQWREALAVRPDEVDHLDARPSRPGATSCARVPSEKILLAELGEAQRRMETKLESPHLTDAARAYIAAVLCPPAGDCGGVGAVQGRADGDHPRDAGGIALGSARRHRQPEAARSREQVEPVA